MKVHFLVLKLQENIERLETFFSPKYLMIIKIGFINDDEVVRM